MCCLLYQKAQSRYKKWQSAWFCTGRLRITQLLAVLEPWTDILEDHSALLSNRKQRVFINRTHSPWTPVTSGIPEGSVLGPPLILIFVNDMLDVMKSFWRMFADATKLFPRVDEIDGTTQIQDNQDTLWEWADTWQITFNGKKHHTAFHFLGSHYSNLPRQKNTLGFW